MGNEERENSEISPREIIAQDEALQQAIGIEVPPDFRVGMKVTIFNAEMRRRREELGLSQKQLAKEIKPILDRRHIFNKKGEPHSFENLRAAISQIEGFYRFPGRKVGKAIADFLGAPQEKIFPEWLKFYLLTRGQGTKSLEFPVSPKILAAAGKSRRFFLPGPPPTLTDPESAILKNVLTGELGQEMKKQLATLSGRERRVLRLRFGLKDGEPKTLEEVGRRLGVSSNRARQIQQNALRKLRHPLKTRQLRDFLED